MEGHRQNRDRALVCGLAQCLSWVRCLFFACRTFDGTAHSDGVRPVAPGPEEMHRPGARLPAKRVGSSCRRRQCNVVFRLRKLPATSPPLHVISSKMDALLPVQRTKRFMSRARTGMGQSELGWDFSVQVPVKHDVRKTGLGSEVGV